jgi:hypothetical protein
MQSDALDGAKGAKETPKMEQKTNRASYKPCVVHSNSPLLDLVWLSSFSSLALLSFLPKLHNV